MLLGGISLNSFGIYKLIAIKTVRYLFINNRTNQMQGKSTILYPGWMWNLSFTIHLVSLLTVSVQSILQIHYNRTINVQERLFRVAFIPKRPLLFAALSRCAVPETKVVDKILLRFFAHFFGLGTWFDGICSRNVSGLRTPFVGLQTLRNYSQEVENRNSLRHNLSSFHPTLLANITRGQVTTHLVMFWPCSQSSSIIM